MTIKLSTSVRNNRATQIANAIDAGSTGGKLNIYSGSRPSSGGGAIDPFTNLLLGTLTFSKPCSSSIDNGVLSFSAIAQDSAADNSGTATWARIMRLLFRVQDARPDEMRARRIRILIDQPLILRAP